MQYRSEIDGLRALAVLPVIFFHAGIDFFSGGYVGVDVFFVISGFLITRILLTEIQSGSFSLINFYERRARRILPALFFVILMSLPFAWLWLLPSDMNDFAKSLIAVPTFSSNILFWQETGYWGANNELKPLLHTWSLAVEEQYYIIFPLFLMLIWKLRKNWLFSIILILAVGSLLASYWGAYNRPTANFFLLPTRLWELAIGALIAIYLLHNKSFKPHKIVAEGLALFGLMMIIYAIIVFDEKTPFPSLYTLIPTVGAGSIILFSSSNTWVGKLLSAKLLVGIGLISYSIYLWHQPMLAFARHANFEQVSASMLAFIAFMSIPMAYLSWRFIEKPFRKKEVFGRKTIFGLAAGFSLFFIVIGLAGINTNGFEKRSTQQHLSLESINNRWRINAGLHLNCTEAFNLSKECKTNEKPEIVIWGDSYAMHLVNGIVASNPDAKIIQLTKYVCGPIFNVAPIVKPDYPLSWAKDCLSFNEKVHTWLTKNKNIKYAVLSSPFSQYLSDDSVVLKQNGEQIKADVHFITTEFKKTLDELVNLGIKPIIFSPPPANGKNLGRCLTRADWNEEKLQTCNFKKSEMTEIRQTTFNFLAFIEEKYPVIRLDKLMCDETHCLTHLDSTYLYRDEGHLSHEGTEILGKKHNFYKMITSQK